MSKQAYIDRVGKLAVEDYPKSKLLPSSVIAQAILESDWGRSELATKANNHFGIKDKPEWEGDIVVKGTWEVIDGSDTTIEAAFRSYGSLEESVKDHGTFLTSGWREGHYKVKGVTNHRQAIQNIASGGYATDPKYASKLINLVETHNLTKFDKEAGVEYKKVDAVIVIDPGHGGTDPGAQGNGLIEKVWNLEVAKILKEKLEEVGLTVILTRADDTYLSLARRAEIANQNGADLFISIHFNAGGGFGWEDFIFNGKIQPATQSFQNDIHNAILPLLSQYDLNNRGKKRANFGVLRMTEMPAVLIEGAFADNAKDAQVLKNSQFKEDLATALTNAVQTHLGNSDRVAPKPVKPAEKPTTTAPRGSTYVVSVGDTLSGIAQKYGVTVDNLAAWNNITNKNLINVGQAITVKEGTSVYTIKSGDTLSGIASKFDTTTDALVSLNGITNPDLINVGQRIKVNGTAKPVAPPKKASQNTYTVKAGDTLSEIAQRFGMTTAALAKNNNISNANLISVGQKLNVGSGRKVASDKTYTVKVGDTLSEIAVKLGVSQKQLAQKNNIKNSHLIQVGQKIKY